MYPFYYQRVNVNKGNGSCYICEVSVAKFPSPCRLGTKVCASQRTDIGTQDSYRLLWKMNSIPALCNYWTLKMWLPLGTKG